MKIAPPRLDILLAHVLVCLACFVDHLPVTATVVVLVAILMTGRWSRTHRLPSVPCFMFVVTKWQVAGVASLLLAAAVQAESLGSALAFGASGGAVLYLGASLLSSYVGKRFKPAEPTPVRQ